ncbi:MAG: universal stress protein [Myxococcales bacterium]|nr:universal stress protein [Myxococcales bacterium]
MPTIERILVPVDFSACSRAALDYAVWIAGLADPGADPRAPKMSIDVLHVWEPPHLIAPEVRVGAREGPGQTLAEFARSHAGHEMEALLATLEQRSGARVRGRLETGDPCATIVKVAADERFHIIVMGTHGRSGLSHLFAGSIAEKVVRRAPCPVLTLRAPPHPAAPVL